MSTLKARNAPHQPQADGKLDRPDPYQQDTDLIIEHLERGVVPWRCPWNREVGRPRNFQSGHAYQGVNVVLLGCRYAASPWWMTYRQAQARGGHVRKGEHGAMVVKYGTFSPKDGGMDAETRRQGMFLRAFTGFNASQIEGIVFPEPVHSAVLSEDERNRKAEAIVEAMPQRPAIRDGSGQQSLLSPRTV